VGHGGRVRYSADGEFWIAAPSKTVANLESVSFRGGLFVAGGQGGVIVTSRNGTLWTPRESNQSVNIWSLAATADGFDAVGNMGLRAKGASSILLTSTDGENWAERPSGRDSGLNAIHYAHGVHLTTGFGGKVTTTPDLSLFRREVLGADLTLNAATSTESVFILVGQGGVILRSVAKSYAGWLVDNYSPSELLDPANGHPHADPAGTGVSNLLRYAFGIDGSESAFLRLPRHGISETSESARLHLSYIRPAGMRGVEYVVDVSEDLATWKPLEDVESIQTISLEGDLEFVQVRDVVSVKDGGERRFLRVRVQLLD
jgi:hypothetical protein